MNASNAHPNPFVSAWTSICAALDKHYPEWMTLADTPELSSVEAIRRLAEGAIPVKGQRPGLTSQAIIHAAEKLVRGKGRYHSEQNYRALASLFGITVPDLEPLEGDAITVTEKALLFAVGEAYATGYNHGHLNTVDELPYASDALLRDRGAEAFYDHLDPDAMVSGDANKLDAERWRSLLGSGRLRVLGAAGFKPAKNPGIDGPSNPDFRHFGMEFWTHHRGWDVANNSLGQEILTGYADQMRANLAKEAAK